MAIETQWVDVRRTWEENTEYSYEHDGNVCNMSLKLEQNLEL
jgi:hypothetical protein